jgi:hypothetical protein
MCLGKLSIEILHRSKAGSSEKFANISWFKMREAVWPGSNPPFSQTFILKVSSVHPVERGQCHRPTQLKGMGHVIIFNTMPSVCSSKGSVSAYVLRRNIFANGKRKICNRTFCKRTFRGCLVMEISISPFYSKEIVKGTSFWQAFHYRCTL